jgi:hypothetical protein
MYYIRITPTQELAILAKLNMALGRTTFDQYFLGFEIRDVCDHTLNAYARDEACAAVIEASYAPYLALAAEAVLQYAIGFVNVLPREWSSLDC